MELTWLGHSAFRLDAGGKRIYIDPFLNGNPKCPEDEKTPERVDIIAVTHGHGDHVGDAVELSKQHGCTVAAPVELAYWLGAGGGENRLAPQKAGPRAGTTASTRTRAPPSRSTTCASPWRTRSTRALTTTSRTWASRAASSC